VYRLNYIRWNNKKKPKR